MGAERRDERAIFNEAAELQSPEERRAYLDKACGDDAELRSAVEELLRLHDTNRRFLDAPILAGMTILDTSPVSEGPGDVIGRYKLLQQIGEGGFGVVYMADQLEPVRRRVALKVIKLGMDTNSVVARFEAERQALAMMEHPNIARALDAGATETGRPYFVMELVRGIPITEYCDRNNLSTEERLELFVQVCSAVQHAHQKGVIHRDLKPSNVLVTLHDGKPVPKVIDFGIARAMDRPLTERTLFTSFGQFVGTPQYMSPEQAEMSGLDIDTRADIYTLGVLLYELLTGTAPFEEETFRLAGYDEVCRIIREVEPPRPSTRISTMGDQLTEVAKHRQAEPAALSKLIRGDLDWIVMKALEKDRTRVKVTASVLVAVALVLGLSLAAAGLIQAIRQRDRALEAYRAQTEAERKQEFAERRADEQERLAETERQAKDVETAAKHEEQRRRSLTEAYALVEGRNYEQALQRLKEAALVKYDQATHLMLWGLRRRYQNRPLATLSGHTGCAYRVAFSPDGKLLASAGEDTTVRLWDAATGTEVAAFRGHADQVLDVAFSPDRETLASGSLDGTIRLWDVAGRRELRTLGGHGSAVRSVAFSPDGRTLASGGGKPGLTFHGGVVEAKGEGGQVYELKLWDVATGRELRTLGQRTGSIASVAFSPDGKTLASGSLDGTTRLWDVATGRELRTLGASGRCVAFAPDGRTLAGGGGLSVRLWDVDSGQELRHIRAHPGYVTSVAFRQDGTVLASAGTGTDGTVKLWNAATGEELHRLSHSHQVRSVAFRPDGNVLASAGADGTVSLWDVDTEEQQNGHVAGFREVRSLFAPPPEWVTSVAFSPNGQTLALGKRGVVQFWDVRTAQKPVAFPGHPGYKAPVAFSPDGKTLVSAGFDKAIRFWDATTVKPPLRTLTGPAGPVLDVAFRPDGKVLALASYDKTVRLCDAQTGTEMCTLAGHTENVGSVAFSPGGGMLASGSYDRTIKLWDVATGQEVRTLAGHTDQVRSVAFSPDGKSVASASQDGTVKLWDARAGTELRTLSGHAKAVNSVAFSVDGKVLASGSDDHTIKLWDLATGAERRTLSGHTSEVYSVAFSPASNALVSKSTDGTLRLWDVATGGELRTLSGSGDRARVDSVAFSSDGEMVAECVHNTVTLWDVAEGRALFGLGGRVTSAAFSPDGTTLAAGNEDGSVDFWDLATGGETRSPIEDTARIASMALSPDGKTVATGKYDGSVTLWDVATGRERYTQAAGCLESVAFSPDGQTFASGVFNRVRLWDVATGRERPALAGPGGRVTAVAFSVRLWDVATGRERPALAGPSGRVTAVAFSPDGQTLASGTASGSVKLWDLATRSELAALSGRHFGRVLALAFSPDGSTLASGARAGTMRLWDVASGAALVIIGPFPGRGIGVESLAFSPDGRRLACGVGNNTLVHDFHAYDEDIERWLGLAEQTTQDGEEVVPGEDQ